MAKETKETKKTAEKTVENVVEEIRNENKLQKENVDKALAKIKEEKDEQQQRKAKHLIMNAEYSNLKELIQLRARRREEKITKDALTKSKENLDKVLSGEITPEDYKEVKRKCKEEKSKAMHESDEQLDKDLRELRASYAGNYCWEWD